MFYSYMLLKFGTPYNSEPFKKIPQEYVKSQVISSEDYEKNLDYTNKEITVKILNV